MADEMERTWATQIVGGAVFLLESPWSSVRRFEVKN